MKNTKHALKIYLSAIFVFAVCALPLFGQSPDEPQNLEPNQTITREMIGAATHRYKFDLKANDFFQVRVKQKGVDVALKLLNSDGKTLATMDSPNGTEDFEVLTWVSANSGSFVLEVSNSDAKIEKKIYTIKRESARPATENDKRRIKIERAIVEIISSSLAKEGQILSNKTNTFALEARAKVNDSLLLHQSMLAKENEEILTEIIKDSGVTPENISERLIFLRFLSKRLEPSLLDIIAKTYDVVGEWQKKVDYLKLEVKVYEEIQSDKNFLEKSLANPNPKEEIYQNKFGQGLAFTHLGITLYGQFGQREEALKYYNLALVRFQSLYQEKQDIWLRFQEASILELIAVIYGNEAKSRKESVEYLEKSIEIYKSLPDSAGKIASCYGGIGGIYLTSFEIDKALLNIKIALNIYQETNDKFNQSITLDSISAIYLKTNNKVKLRETAIQTLEVLQSSDFVENAKKSRNLEKASESLKEQIQDSIERFRSLLIAGNYEYLEDYQKSILYLDKGLQISSKNKDAFQMLSDLNSIGYGYYKLKKWDKSLEYFNRSLSLTRQVGTKEDIVWKLTNVSRSLIELGKSQEALVNLNEALVLLNYAGVGENKAFSNSYAEVLNNLARAYSALGNRRLAIFYGVQTINGIQRERQQLQNLDIESQRGFLENNEKPYRRLADWLFEAGQFADAEKVLRMLKEEEFSNFVRRDPEEIDKLGQRLEPNSAEKPILVRYTLLADNLAKIGVEYEKLKKEKGAACQTDVLCQDLKQKVTDANTAFSTFLEKELVKEFDKIPKRNVKNDIEIEKSRRALLSEQNAVSIYTLVGEDRLRVFLTTSQVQIDRKKEIKAADLNNKIKDFREALKDPKVDPRPLGKELYDILIAPIEKQIQDSGAKTLLFSLDGTLRYIPIAALWDGKQYLVEKYRIVLLTSATKEKLIESSKTDWKIFGGGVTEKSEVSQPEKKGFGALPSVKTELDSIIRGSDTQGIFDGSKFINGNFTKENIEAGLSDNSFNVLHLATHFSLGNDNGTSFLLLGNNQTLTLKQIRDDNDIELGNLDLVVLSACETAFGNSGNGGEVDSSATFFELNGAKSVIASLWSVADNSTSELMIAFYQIRRENPNISKAEALRLAQVRLLNGKYKTGETPTWRGTQIVGTPNLDLLPFKTDANAPFAHPYYWSPFILIGNWR